MKICNLFLGMSVNAASSKREHVDSMNGIIDESQSTELQVP